jgi:exonuclease III
MQMRIITWNCNGNFRDKEEILYNELKPDIAIIPESENPEKFVKKTGKPHFLKYEWVQLQVEGRSQGVGVYFYSPYEVKMSPAYSDEIKTAVPHEVTNPKTKLTFHLLAIWANNPATGRRYRYVYQVWKALEHYKAFLETDGLVVGDFNSYQLVAPKKLDVKEILHTRGFESAYHHFFKEAIGQHTRPTLYKLHQKTEPFMVDYCFASSAFLSKLKLVTVGTYDQWNPYSDHMPLVCDFDLN